MDIKDFILIGGGILIVMVIAHGFWIAYRAKREPYRIDIVPDLIPEDVDDMERLRGELPNGGSRIVRRIDGDLVPEQDALDLQIGSDATPTLMDVASGVTEGVADRINEKLRKPRVVQAPPRPAEVQDTLALQDEPTTRSENTRQEPKLLEPTGDRASSHAKAGSDALAESRSGGGEPLSDRLDRRRKTANTGRNQGTEKAQGRVAEVQLMTERRDRPGDAPPTGTRLTADASHSSSHADEAPAAARGESQGPELDRTVEELLIINVVASRGHKFNGEDIVRALRGQGLRYGDMNIFHRQDPLSKVKQFSVANMLEPGHFDLSDLAKLDSPGMSFFLQLPGPEDASDAFDDMIGTAKQVAFQLGGELRDEQMSVMTGQTREHMRQRIADFARRKLSIRA